MEDESMEVTEDIVSYEEKLIGANIISKPMAPEKVARRLFKLIRKAKRHKKTDCSIKSILKCIEKKGAKGIVLLAGDVSPIDTISHVPIVCEDYSIPYCYVPSKSDLALSLQSVVPIPITFVQRDEAYGPLFDKCHGALDELLTPF